MCECEQRINLVDVKSSSGSQISSSFHYTVSTQPLRTVRYLKVTGRQMVATLLSILQAVSPWLPLALAKSIEFHTLLN